VQFTATPEDSMTQRNKQTDAHQTNQCIEKTELLVCPHVKNDRAEIEVLLVGDDHGVDFALCLECSLADDPADLEFIGLCRDCGRSSLNVPDVMPTSGKWQVGSLNAN
jgi:hypothetical protein